MTATLTAPARAAFLAPASAESVPALRADVTGRLAEWGIGPDITADAALLLTEMLTNALIHGRAEELAVRLDRDRDMLRVEVDDQLMYPPYPARQSALDVEDPDLEEVDADGRGVFLLEEIADAWGCRIVRDNPERGIVGVKTVFAEFRLADD